MAFITNLYVFCMFLAMQKTSSKMPLYVQDCKRETGRISAVYALGVDAAPTLQARACFVERTSSAMDFTSSAVRSPEVDLACY